MTALDTAAAFDRLYRREHQRLLRYAGQKIGPEDASDVAQDAFMRLLDGELFAKVENPRAYLTRIARNLSVDRTRRQTRDRVASYRLLLGRDGAACPDQTLRIEAMDVLHLSRRVVRGMPPKAPRDRKSVVLGKSGTGSVDLGGVRITSKNTKRR